MERYDKGQTIVQEGEMGDRFYIIVKGKVEILKKHSTKGEAGLAILEDGDYFGEVALLQKTQRIATARPCTPTFCLFLSRQQFLQCLENLSEVKKVLEENVLHRLQQARQL